MTRSDPIFDKLTGEGQPFAIGSRDGVRQFVNAPGDLNTLIETARGHGDKTFLVEGDRRLTFEQTFALRDALVCKLGLEPGQRAVICMRNRSEWMIAFLAIMRSGAVAVLVNSRGSPAALREAVEEVDPAVVLADEERAELLREGGYNGSILQADSFPTAGPVPDKHPVRDAEDPCAILFTSGTTGRVKGVVLTHRNLINGLMSVQLSGQMVLHDIAAKLGMAPEDLRAQMPQQATMLVYPLFHISGLGASFLNPLCAGTKLVLMRRWSGEEAARIIELEGITMFSGVPTMLWDILHAARDTGADLSSLRNIASGGQALPVNLLDEVRTICPNAVMGTGYGMTETSGSVAMAVGEDFIRNRASAGRVLSLVDMRIEGPDGKILGPGETGEIVVRGPVVMQGYWQNPEETAKTVTSDGWLKTGDVGCIDSEGYVFIADRKKDMVISGGENIYCAEVERVLGEMPGIAECATFGIPDDRLGELLVAVVRAHHPIGAEEVKERVGKMLARYKAPGEVAFTSDPLPRNALGKVDKITLRGRWPEFSRGT